MKQKHPLWIPVLFLFIGITAWLFTIDNGETAVAMPMSQGASDCNIQWAEPFHDTFNPDYRSAVGPTTPGTTVKLRLRVAQDDITTTRIRVWDDRADSETYYNMVWDGTFDTDPTTYDYYFADIPVGSQPTILYYFFEINDDPGTCTADQDFYVDDDPKFYGGGTGAMSDSYDDSRSFQITVYDPSFSVPEWMQRGVVYQIFPDRFRDGDAANNPLNGRFSYDRAGGAIVRSNQSDWNYTICDPRGTYLPCPNYYGDNFYGGDLQGVIDKIEDGYFDSLGVTVLYLNPIFLSPSNHKYDTADYLTIDPDFGDLATFQTLISTANAHGMQVILDGVFNHTSSDSAYFDFYRRYDAAHNLTSPATPGIDDNSGACESPNSLYRSWYYIPDSGSPATDPSDRCDSTDVDDTGGAWTETYTAWYGYGSLPKLQANSTAVRNLIWNNGTNSVGPYWIDQGARGWRFDVGGDVDPGLTHDPGNDYWEGFRTAVRTVSADTLLLGEEWGDASTWLLGNEWDSVMNYRFRSTLFGWLFTGCTGNGCSGGTTFEDNDNNSGSASGSISYLSPSQFNARLLSIWEDYPAPAFHAMMNLPGSHDTNRLRWVMKKINNDNDAVAIQRMKEWWLFSFTYPGAPTIYYGDEIGLNHDAVWANDKWEDDPYNRIPFPWDDASGSTYGYGSGNDTNNNAANADLLSFTRKMASVRHSYRALQDGAVQHGLVIDDANQVYGFARTYDSGGGNTQTALIALNRSGATHNATFSGLNATPYNLPDGTLLYDAIEGNNYTVSGGSVTVPVNSSWGVVLLEQDKIDQPTAVTTLDVAENGADKELSWSAITSDTNGDAEVATLYRIHAGPSGFIPNAGNLLGTASPAQFGSTNQMVHFTHVGGTASGLYYAVCAVNGAGISSQCNRFTPTAVQLSQISATQPTTPLWLSLAFGLVLLLAGIVIFRSKLTK